MELPQLAAEVPHLADVAPSVLAAMGVAGFDARVDLPKCVTGACVLLIDGLGAELLDTYADFAPVMSALQRQTLQVGFPSTTAAGLAAIGTGRRSGEHGVVGYTFRLPGTGMINALGWRTHPSGRDLRATVPPEQVQPLPTVFERGALAGIPTNVISDPEFAGSGLTRAVFRGGHYIGVQGLDELAAAVRAAVAGGEFCFAYHREVDLPGHLYGPGSTGWRTNLRRIDRVVGTVIDALPPGGVLAVVADHGMVAINSSEVVDADESAALLDGVQVIGGEPRARHIYTADGAADMVLAAWRERLADRAWVATREEAIAANWFGKRIGDNVRPRIGDVVAAARGSAAVIRGTAEPRESSFIGQHGSLTSAEQLVPLLVSVG